MHYTHSLDYQRTSTCSRGFIYTICAARNKIKALIIPLSYTISVFIRIYKSVI